MIRSSHIDNEKTFIMKKHPVKQAVCILAALLCFLYGIAVRAVGSGTNFFLVWIGLGLFFLLLAAAIHIHIPEKMPGALLWMIRVAALLCLVLFITAEAAICSHFTDSGSPNLDYIIVLGAQVKADGPSVVLQYRLDKAVDYLEENPETVCIVTGGQGSNEPCTEAECMAEYLIQNGIAADHIIQENEALNTVQNIIYSSKYFNPETDTVGIVTNNFHMYRALHLAEKQGIQHVTGISADSTAFYLPNNCLREFLGIMKDLVKGNLAL